MCITWGSPWVWVWGGYGDRNFVATAALIAAASIQIYIYFFLGGGDRGAEGGGVHSPLGEGSGKGARGPLPRNFFFDFDLKMAICGAFFGAVCFAVQPKL